MQWDLFSFSKETPFGGLGLAGEDVWKEGRGVCDGEVRGSLNAACLEKGGPKLGDEGLVSRSSQQRPVGFRGGLETGVRLGSSPSDPPERRWGRHSHGQRKPSTVTWVCGQDQSDKQARGGRFPQERMAECHQSLRPLRSLLPAGSLPRVPDLGVSRPQNKAWAPRALPAVCCAQTWSSLDLSISL